MSIFKPRNLLLLLAFLLAGVLIILIVSQRRPESQIETAVKALPKGIDVSLQDIDYTHIEDGLARWRMIAKQVERVSDSGILKIVNPRLSFFDERGEVVGSMQAGAGTVSDDYQFVRLTERVELKNESGYAVYTDLLDYDHKKHLAVTDRPVRLETEGLLLQGRGMSFYVLEKKIELNADVKGRFQPR